VKNMTATLKRKPVIGVLQITGVVVLMILAFIYSRAPEQADTTATTDTASSKDKTIPLITVITPSVTSQQLVVSSTGSVAVRSYVTLTSQVTGRVTATSGALRNGGKFTAGQTLVTLEQRDFTLALDQVQADVTSAQATLQLSEAEASVDISSYQRLNPAKDVPPLIAKEPQITKAKAQLQAAIARRDMAQVNLERSVYSLPFSGTVVESSADEGQILNAGQSFGRVYALDAVEIVISLAPQELAKIAPATGRVATITADGLTFKGRIDRVAAERNTRTQFSQVFLTTDINHTLTPGTFVTVELSGAVIDSTFMLPESTLQVEQTFWIVKNDTIQAVSAKILGRNNGQYLVAAFDFADGIVTGSIPGAREGMAVRLAEAN
jgi:RND family efflux transporter MFP subunit